MNEKYRPSNATEGDSFRYSFCEKCCKDKPEQENYCDILTNTMAYQVEDENYPSEWIYNDDGNPICTAFVEDTD